MKKLILIVFILMLTLLMMPSQTYAAWWNPISWFLKEKSSEVQPQNDTGNNAIQESQIINTNIEEAGEQSLVTPSKNSVPAEAKSIEVLRAEVVTLKTNLDNLYKAHSGLVNDHNALLKYTTDLEKRFSTLQNQPAANNVSSDILYRVSELERKTKLTSEELYGTGITGGLNSKVENICNLLFDLGCPRIGIGGSLDSRIKKLERGY